jgi:hypothetical protein
VDDPLSSSGHPLLRSILPWSLILDRSSMSALIIGDRSSSGRRRYCVPVFIRHACCEVDSHLPRFWSIRPRYRSSRLQSPIPAARKQELSDDESRAGSFGKMDVGSGSMGDGDIMEDMDSQLAFPTTAPLCSMSAPENPVDGTFCDVPESSTRASVIIELITASRSCSRPALLGLRPPCNFLADFSTVAPLQTSEDQRTRPLR